MKTITEQNALIAEFMGIEPRQINATSYGWNDGPFFACSYPTKAEVMQAVSKYAKYHESWDWLMPVVEKIESILPDDSIISIQYKDCIIPINEAEFDIIEKNAESKIEATFNAVVEFIEWYNQEQAKKGDK